MKTTLSLIVVLFCLSAVYAQDAQNKASLKQVTEADLFGVWTFERAEYWEHTAKTLVLRESITSPDSLGRLLSLCLGNAVNSIAFLSDRAMVSTLLTVIQNAECRLQEFEDGTTWLELQWRDELAAGDTPPLMSRYKIQWAEENLIELRDEALCHDNTGAMRHNMLKMFLKTF